MSEIFILIINLLSAKLSDGNLSPLSRVATSNE